MDEDKIIIIPEKYYMQIYQVKNISHDYMLNGLSFFAIERRLSKWK